tara:strand:- start:2186 stop:2593 length:408 start_codon:yes stop_codon:yes gene_type:complete
LFKAPYIFIILQTKLTKTFSPLQSFQNTFFSYKTLVVATSTFLIIMGFIKEPIFILVSAFYFLFLGTAYKIGSKIEDYAINAAYNWSIKWVLFIAFSYLSGVYINSALVYAIFFFILVNISLNPTFFVVKNSVKT